jgi:hypothetical protein
VADSPAMTTSRGIALAGAALLLLAGCGGGDDGAASGTSSEPSSQAPKNVVFNESDVTDYLEDSGYTVKPTGGGYYDVTSPEGVKCEIYTMATGSADHSAYVGDPNYLMDSSGTVGFQYGGREGNDGDCADALTTVLEGFVPWAEDNGVI